jgi:lipopolysaccharide/colanic/teichoic acid biosynthesis glycosyltransferase
MGGSAIGGNSSSGRPRVVFRATKRALDIVVAASVLLIALPGMTVVAVCIVLESPGPVFYRAQRVGRGGRPLAMLKFRKMPPDASGIALTVRGDARLTRVGRILAKTRLDELPQFWHVLRGEMSLIGPRPESPEFVAARSQDYEEILSVRPGISGLTQLAFAQEAEVLRADDPVADYLERIFPQMCAIDRLYVRRATLAMDLRIAAWTLLTVLLRTPVAVNRSTAATTLRRRPARAATQPSGRDEPDVRAAVAKPAVSLAHEQSPPPR